MSTSFRNLTTEYVKARLQGVKLPLSASGRFNVNAAVKARIPTRLRKAKPQAALEDAPTEEGPPPADDHDFCLVETNAAPQDRDKPDALSHDESGLEELTLVAFLQEHNSDKGAKAGATPERTDTAATTDLRDDPGFPTDTSYGTVSEAPSIGLYTPRDADNLPVLSSGNTDPSSNTTTLESGPPGLSEPASLIAPQAPSSPVSARCVEFTNSPVGSDILNALETFDVEGADLDPLDSDFAVPLRSLQTIYEEDPTALDTSGSLASPRLFQEASAANDVLPDSIGYCDNYTSEHQESLAIPNSTLTSSLPWYSTRLFQLVRLALQAPSQVSYARMLPPCSPTHLYAPFAWSGLHPPAHSVDDAVLDDVE